MLPGGHISPPPRIFPLQIAKAEVNLPAVKNFVELVYPKAVKLKHAPVCLAPTTSSPSRSGECDADFLRQ